MRRFLYYSVLGILFLGTISLPVRRTPWFDINHIADWQLDPSKIVSRLDATETDWRFVRGSAEWARGNSTFIDQVIASIRDNSWFNESGTFENVTLGKHTFKIIITRNTPQTGIQSGAYTGSRTFQNKLEIKRQAENDLALQLFFDSTEALTSNGALMYYNLAKLNPENGGFDNSLTAIVETFIFEKPDGLRRQVYTWKNAPTTTTSIAGTGRVVLDEVQGSGALCFRAVAKVDGTVMKNSLEANFDTTTVNNLYTACGTAKGNDLYYALAYVQNFSFPFYTTAKFGWSGDTNRKEGFCGVSSTIKNYGIFDDKGFVRDGVSASQVPAGYPSPNSGEMSVDSAFIATYTNASGLNYGVPGSDDTSKTFIDGVGSNGNIDFK